MERRMGRKNRKGRGYDATTNRSRLLGIEDTLQINANTSRSKYQYHPLLNE